MKPYSISEEEWRGYNIVRSTVVWMRPEERKAIRKKEIDKRMLMYGKGYEEELEKIPRHIRDRFLGLNDEDNMRGLNAVHRMLLDMKEKGIIRILADNDQTSPEYIDGTRVTNTPDHSLPAQEGKIRDHPGTECF